MVSNVERATPRIDLKTPKIIVDARVCAEVMRSYGMTDEQIANTKITARDRSRTPFIGGQYNLFTGSTTLCANLFERSYKIRQKKVDGYLFRNGRLPKNGRMGLDLTTDRLPEYLRLAKERGDEERASKFSTKLLVRNLERHYSRSLAHELKHKADAVNNPWKLYSEQAISTLLGTIPPYYISDYFLRPDLEVDPTVRVYKDVLLFASIVAAQKIAYYLNPAERRGRKAGNDHTQFPNDVKLVTYIPPVK